MYKVSILFTRGDCQYTYVLIITCDCFESKFILFGLFHINWTILAFCDCLRDMVRTTIVTDCTCNRLVLDVSHACWLVSRMCPHVGTGCLTLYTGHHPMLVCNSYYTGYHPFSGADVQRGCGT